MLEGRPTCSAFVRATSDGRLLRVGRNLVDSTSSRDLSTHLMLRCTGILSWFEIKLFSQTRRWMARHRSHQSSRSPASQHLRGFCSTNTSPWSITSGSRTSFSQSKLSACSSTLFPVAFQSVFLTSILVPQHRGRTVSTGPSDEHLRSLPCEDSKLHLQSLKTTISSTTSPEKSWGAC